VQRRYRAATQRIYCLDKRWIPDVGYNFAIEGSTQTMYTVAVRLPEVRPPAQPQPHALVEVLCTCPDFQKRHCSCKHIYFVFNVLGIPPGQEELLVQDILRYHALDPDPIDLTGEASANEVIDLTAPKDPWTSFGAAEDRIDLTASPRCKQRDFTGQDCCICYEPLMPSLDAIVDASSSAANAISEPPAAAAGGGVSSTRTRNATAKNARHNTSTASSAASSSSSSSSSSGTVPEALVWCSKGCGNTLHQVCFLRWKCRQDAARQACRCPQCRAPMDGRSVCRA
jgi:hypothetical protein